MSRERPHEDDAGVEARAIMAPIVPSLATFLNRMLALPGRNVVTILVGEFSRSILTPWGL